MREIHAPDSKIMHLGCRVHPKFWMLKTMKMHNFANVYTFWHTLSNCYSKMIEMISIVTIYMVIFQRLMCSVSYFFTKKIIKKISTFLG